MPEPRGLLIRIAVLAVGHIRPRQVRHKGSALQQSRLRIFDAPKPRSEISDQLQRSYGGAVALFEPARPARQGAAVLRTRRRSPDHVEVTRRKNGQRFPTTDVKIQAHHLPAQLCEGPAHRASPENSSNKRGILVFHVGLTGKPDHSNEGGAAAGKLQVAQGAVPEPPPLARLVVEEPRVAAPDRSAAGLPSIFARTSSFLDGIKNSARPDRAHGARPDRNANERPRKVPAAQDQSCVALHRACSDRVGAFGLQGCGRGQGQRLPAWKPPKKLPQLWRAGRRRS